MLQSFVPLLQTMHRLHSCTCRLLVAYTSVRHASTGTPMECVYYISTACSITSHACTWEGLRYQFQSGSVSSCFKYQCSYLNTLQAPLLHSCLHEKAKHALMQVQTCSLYVHFTTLARVIILLAYGLKTMTGPITFLSAYIS